MGSLMIEENVVRLAGAAFRGSEYEIHNLIRDAGYQPRRPDSCYGLRKEPADLDESLSTSINHPKARVAIAP